MLNEFPNLRQEPRGFRRLFLDDYFELYVWYERERGPLTGFQLVYGKPDDPHTLTWTEAEGYAHNKVDEGEDSCVANMTPILVPDGIFDASSVLDRFSRAAGALEPAIRDLVERSIQGSGDFLSGVRRRRA